MTDIDRLQERLTRLEARVAALESGQSPTVPDAAQKRKSMSIGEFVRTRHPSSDLEMTLHIAYFLERYDGLESINIRDLTDGFSRAREPKPSNLSDTVAKNIKKGYLMDIKNEKDNLKAWVLTNSGAAHVEGAGAAGGSPATGRSRHAQLNGGETRP